MIHHVLSPAKLNLFLYVTGKRDDGFHELFTLMTCIDLCDDMYFDFDCHGIFVGCSHPDVPEDSSNLAHRAATIFFETLSASSLKGKPDGVVIKIRKRIPVGGGLGGGSSNAAVVLKTLNSFFGQPFSMRRLQEMAVCLGADVPFFINGWPAFASGIGEKLSEPVLIFPCHVLVLCPQLRSSTALVYKNLDLADCALTKSGKFNINQFSKFHGRNVAFDPRVYLANDLETSAFKLYPDLRRFQDELNRSIPEKVLMTGSGACFFVLFEDSARAFEAYKQLSAEWQERGVQLYLTSIANYRHWDKLMSSKKECS